MSLLTLLTSAPPDPAPGDGSQVWELIYHSLGYHQETDNDLVLQFFSEGWATPLQPIHEIVRERDDSPAWAVLLDPDLCPPMLLPYLAQFVGCVLTPEMSEAQVRAEIAHPTGWCRGQTESIEIAIRRTLFEGKTLDEGTLDWGTYDGGPGDNLIVIVRPNRPVVGSHYIRTLASQTPEVERTKAVARAVVPAWSALDYAAITSLTFDDIRTAWASFEALAEDISSFGELRELLPTELP